MLVLGDRCVSAVCCCCSRRRAAARAGHASARDHRRGGRRGARDAVSQVGDGAHRRGEEEGRRAPTPTSPTSPTSRARPGAHRGRSTRENVEKAFADLAARAQAERRGRSSLLIGHGSFDGTQAAFNLPGPDLTADDYATLLDKLPAAARRVRQHGSSSGAFLPALAGPGRTIVTATKTGGERNETRFPGSSSRPSATTPPIAIATATCRSPKRSTTPRPRSRRRSSRSGYILTEHATIDDGGDGKLAATLFLGIRARARRPRRSTSPTRRCARCSTSSDALERQIAGAEAAQRVDGRRRSTTQQLEKLLTELALKTQAIRELEAKK